MSERLRIALTKGRLQDQSVELFEAIDVYKRQDDPRAFSNKPAWKKFIILVAGSFMNFLTGLVLLILIFGQATAFVTPVIADFMEGFPYESEAGLLPGDRIVSVNGEHIFSKSDLDFFFSRAGGENMDPVSYTHLNKIL